MEEARRIEVAGAGGVHQLAQAERFDRVALIAREHQGAQLTAGQGRHLAAAAHLINSLLKAVRLVEGGDLHFVGEQHIDMAIDQLLEALAVPFDAESIGEGEGHLAPLGADQLGRGNEGPLGGFAVPEVALQIEQLGVGHHLQVQVGRIQADGGPQVGAHRALGIGGDQDQATGG